MKMVSAVIVYACILRLGSYFLFAVLSGIQFLMLNASLSSAIIILAHMPYTINPK